MTCQLLVRRRERDARKRAIPSQFFKVLFSSARRREERYGRLFVYTCRERAAKRRPRRGRTWGYTSSVRHPSPACPVHTMRRASPPWPAAEGEEVSVGTGVVAVGVTPRWREWRVFGETRRGPHGVARARGTREDTHPSATRPGWRSRARSICPHGRRASCHRARRGLRSRWRPLKRC